MNIAALTNLLANHALNGTNGLKQQTHDESARHLERTVIKGQQNEEHLSEAQIPQMRQSSAYRVTISPAALRKMSLSATA
ncbi:MAG: hypothetical protein HQL58_03505 [Magnetococcales bacterium]|nr:hypothetical protein [Magnetococcales bacterium]